MASLSAREERETYPAPHRITLDEYRRMGEAGVLPPDARVELLQGELIDMAPIGAAHANTVDHLVTLFAPVTTTAILRVQNPLRVGTESELLPDVTLLRRHPQGYPTAAPGPEDVLLLIEVSDTSLRYDRDRKLRLYAAHGVIESWLLDLNARQLEIHRVPGSSGYQEVLLPREGEVVSPSLLPAFRIAAGGLFPA